MVNFITANADFQLKAFSYSNWARCPLTRISTTGYCTSIGDNCLSCWSAKKQSMVSRSSTYALGATELNWPCYLLFGLFIPITNVHVLYCDNLIALHITISVVFYTRTKHVGD